MKVPDTNVPDPNTEPTVSVDRCAAVLGISRTSAYRAVASGSIPSFRIGGRILIPSNGLLRLLGLVDVKEASE